MKRTFTVINLVLVAAAVYYSVEIFYGVVAAQLDTGTASMVRTTVNAASIRKTSYPFGHYKPIIERNLFRTKKEALQDVGVDVGNLEQTELKLKLLGTVTGDENSAYAVIEDEKERRQNLFRVGDAIQSAALKMILREKVILSVGGRDEILEMEKPRGSGPGASARERRSPGRSSKVVRKPQIQRISLKRSVIEEAAGNMNQLMKDVNIQPHFENGRPDGLRLSRIKRDSVFRKMGLRRGDIITGVDGQTIESVDDALALYNRIRSADNVKLEIRRRGQPKILDYNIR